MKIEVQLFSRLRDVAGTGRLVEEAAPGQTVGDLLAALYARFPGLRAWDPHVLTAVDLEYVGRDRPLREGDTLAVMPPVQGG